jgi:hypothetical protein
VTIYFQDDQVRLQSEATAQQLLSAAMAEINPHDNSVQMAQKALKYRKILDRMVGVDVTSPSFDVSKFLGVEWCKTPNLRDFCARDEQTKQPDTSQAHAGRSEVLPLAIHLSPS